MTSLESVDRTPHDVNLYLIAWARWKCASKRTTADVELVRPLSGGLKLIETILKADLYTATIMRLGPEAFVSRPFGTGQDAMSHCRALLCGPPAWNIFGVIGAAQGT